MRYVNSRYTVYYLISGIIFSLAALINLSRAMRGLPLMIAGATVPLWASWVIFIVAVILAIYGFWLGISIEESGAAKSAPHVTRG